jgi:hypothetical protein
MQDSLPFLTTDLPGVGGVIKTRPEDFFVEELLLYEASSSGTLIYALIEKKGSARGRPSTGSLALERLAAADMGLAA